MVDTSNPFPEAGPRMTQNNISSRCHVSTRKELLTIERGRAGWSIALVSLTISRISGLPA